MTHIVESSCKVDEHEQAGGGRYVVERHVDNLGRAMTFGPYLLADGLDAQAIMTQRAARLNAEFALREAEAAEAANGRTPWSHLEFEAQLGDEAVAGMLAFFAAFEASGALSAAQKAAIRVGWHQYQRAQYIERPLRPSVLALLALLQSLGLVSAERVAAVTAAAEA
jgi:hypothetical protein